jgi:hypothetical protein
MAKQGKQGTPVNVGDKGGSSGGQTGTAYPNSSGKPAGNIHGSPSSPVKK